MEYTIHWVDYINPQNACNTLEINEFKIDELENAENYKKVLKEITDGLPKNSKHSGELMGDWEFECSDIFNAENMEEARMVTHFDYDCEVFGVFNKNNKKLFDDMDCEDITQDTRQKIG